MYLALLCALSLCSGMFKNEIASVCVSSRIEGVPDDFFFVGFVVELNHAQFFEDATAFHEFFFKMSSSGTT